MLWKNWSYAYGCIAEGISFPLIHCMYVYKLLLKLWMFQKAGRHFIGVSVGDLQHNYGSNIYCANFLKYVQTI